MRTRRLLMVSLAICIFAAGVVSYPPLRLSALVLLGRSPECPYPQAIRSRDNLRAQIRGKDEILRQSKMLEKDSRGFEHWQTPMGNYWIPDGSRFVLPYDLAEQARKIYGSGERFVQPGDTVLDCGANVGVFTRQALDAGAKVVVAIEPAPENLECLRRNFEREITQGNVVLYPKGVWDKDDFLTMNVDRHNSAADSFVLHPEGSQPMEGKLPLTTIDKVVDELHLNRVDFIKMDIEGAEPKALAGARGTLERWHPKLSISAYHKPNDPVEIPQVIRSAWSGYRKECGPCSEDHARIRPDILWFH